MKYAYVSLLNDDSSDFIYNIILALSLLKTKTKYEIILLYTLTVPQYKLNILKYFFSKLIKVEHIKSSKKVFNVNLSYHFTVFQIFNLIDYDKIVYLDKYQLINKNIDFIFNINYPAGLCYKNKFKRSHMFLIKPNKIIYEVILKIIDETNLTKKYLTKEVLNLVFNKINCFSSKLDFQKYLNNYNYEELFIIDYNFINKPLNFFNNNKKNNFLNKFKTNKHFYLPWFNIYIKLYNNFNKKKINIFNPYSIISNDYNLYLKNSYPNLKKVKITKSMYINLQKKLNEFINNYFTINDVINYLLNNNIKIFIYGGSIRDLIQNIEIKDIDCAYVGNYKDIYKILKQNKFLNFKQGGTFPKYFNIENDELELNNLDVFRKSLDGPCNSLIYDISTKYIYDLTGYGIHDSKKKIWRLNPGDTYEEWSRDHNCLLHRLVKMMLKGYKVPINDRKFIYNELYYNEKDRTYWFYVNRFADEEFYNLIQNDIDKLKLEYTGNDFIELVKLNLKRI